MIDKRNTTSAPKPHSAAMQPVHAPITRNFTGVGEVKGKKMILCMWRFNFLFKNSFPTRYKYAGDILMHVCFFSTWKGMGKPKKIEVVKFDRLFFRSFSKPLLRLDVIRYTNARFMKHQKKERIMQSLFR